MIKNKPPVPVSDMVSILGDARERVKKSIEKTNTQKNKTVSDEDSVTAACVEPIDLINEEYDTVDTLSINEYETDENDHKIKIQLFSTKDGVERYVARCDADKEMRYRAKQFLSMYNNNGEMHRELQSLPENWKSVLDEMNLLFPNFKEFNKLIDTYLTLNSVGDSRIELPSILLVGPAGVGKTFIVNWLAERLNVSYTSVDMASAQSVSKLSGTDSYYSNSEMGAVASLLCSIKYANPFIVLDEIDKSGRAEAHNALYTLLEKQTASKFKDSSVTEFTLDASYVSWIATANDIDKLNDAIKSRFIVIEVDSPTPDELITIIKTINNNLLTDSHWGSYFDKTELPEDVISLLIKLSPREIKQHLRSAYGMVVKNNRKSLTVDDFNITFAVKEKKMGFI